MPSGSYDRQRFASHNPAHPSTWVRVCVLYLERLWRSQFLRLSEPAFGLPAASHVQQQRRRTPTQAQGRLWSDNQIKPNSLFTSLAPLPNYRRLLKTLPQPLGLNRTACPETPLLGKVGVMSGGSSRRYPPELRERAVRMVAEISDQHNSEWAAISEVARLLGVGCAETVRKWVRQRQVDAGSRPGTTTEEPAELKRLKRENAELRRANAILKTASAFFAAELDRPQH